MSKSTLILFIASLWLSPALAQSTNFQNDSLTRRTHNFKHEVRVGYGTPSLVTLAEGVHGGEDGYSSRPVTNYSGTVSFAYRYILSRRYSIGFAIAYENENGNMQVFVNSSNNGAITANSGIFKRNVFTIAPEIMIHYPREKNSIISAYGYLGIGISYLNELDTYSPAYYITHYNNGVNSLGNSREILYNHTEISLQICPIGISVGGRIRGFVELGFGYKGIINSGLAVKL